MESRIGWMPIPVGAASFADMIFKRSGLPVESVISVPRRSNVGVCSSAYLYLWVNGYFGRKPVSPKHDGRYIVVVKV